MIERTLLNIKPDAVERNLVGEIIRRVEERNYRIVTLDKVWLTSEEAKAFYKVHEGKSFFEELVGYMSSGPCVPLVVEGENVIEGIRELIGATDPSKAEPGTIRKDFAESMTRNSVHASDARETAGVEIGFFFSGRKLVHVSDLD